MWLPAFSILLAGVIIYLLFWPIPAEPAAWTPPDAPELTGAFAVNDRLATLERLQVVGPGPEDIAIDPQGRIYSGLEDGRIMRLQPDGSKPQTVARTGGRPLGLAFDREGNLLVADAYKGLLSISPAGMVQVLAAEHDGDPLRLTNHLDVAADGTVYFSESSTKFTLADDILDLLENRPNGRLLAYDPDSGSTRLVLDNLHFANGVAVSPDHTSVLVAETNRYRIRRVWLAGPRAGEAEVFVDNLPGFPDNINRSSTGRYWVGLPSPRKSDVDALYARPFLRRILLRLPKRLHPAPQVYGFVLAFDQDGNVVANFQDPNGSYKQITTAIVHDGMLYLGSLAEDAIGRLPLS